jgi:steroid 5-alpha reductase family enzyme
MTILNASLILFLIALLASAAGFRRVVYFISIGYALSIAVMALAAALIYRAFSLFSGLHLLLLFAWGARLGYFVLRRELQPSFQPTARETEAQYGRADLARKLLVWVGVSLLYVAMFLPGLAHAARPIPGQALLELAGLGVMAGGLVLEAAADQQKSAFKTRSPQAFTNTGLYRWVRCPNYLGEILFWVGSWIAGTPFYHGWLEWAVGLIGLVCIVLVMLGSTRRLELAQDARYGSSLEYQAYIRRVPILIPWVALYSLKKLKIYLG